MLARASYDFSWFVPEAFGSILEDALLCLAFVARGRNATRSYGGQLFVNVVTSEKLAKPYSTPSKNRPGGEMWSMPVAVGQMRMEKDKCAI